MRELHRCLLSVVFVFLVSNVTVADYPPLKPAPAPAPQTMNGLPLLFEETFEDHGSKHWEPTDTSAWKVIDQQGNKVYALTKKKSDFNPPVRSPFNRSLRKDIVVGDFVLDVRFQSTHPDYGHRDLCLFFGYQDDSHLHYVHFGKKADPHANQIFIVNEAPRKAISLTTTEGTPWTDNWHHARIVRDTKSGSIKVYYDDLKNPAMTAKDKTFTWGRVGIGSFDDIGNFDHVRLYGRIVEPKK